MSSSKALSITELRKTYATGLKALDGVSLDVERGEFFALLGPNGAGKSTLIGIVCSLVNRDSGGVSVFGEDLALHPGRVKSRIGLVPQEFNFNMWETPWAILLNQAGYYGIDRATARPAGHFSRRGSSEVRVRSSATRSFASVCGGIDGLVRA